MFSSAASDYQTKLDEIRAAGLFKSERVIETPQAARITVGGKRVINFCANNYLGLSNHPRLIKAAKQGLEEYGLGLSSVRFICGTQTVHKELEQKISAFLQMDDTILYAACFDANGGLFEPLLGEEDAIISDELNHASIIDGVRLCKAMRYRYLHADMADLEQKLKQARKDGAKKIMITTDGVFSMDGNIAKLEAICDLADEHQAMVHVDDCHATGFLGKTGRGSIEACGVAGRVDVISSTLGKALGGAVGGFSSGKAEIINLLRQRSRPYLFSNSLPPALVSAGIACLDLISDDTSFRDRLEANTRYFREHISQIGYEVREGVHPIVPVMLGDAKLAANIANDLLDEGIYVIGFSYPVVPKDQARIRVQISGDHSLADLQEALAAFARVGERYGISPENTA